MVKQIKLEYRCKKIKAVLSSFDNVKSIKFYDGTLVGNKLSEKNSEEFRKLFNENFKTKSVKVMKQAIDYTSIKSDSSDLLAKFIRKCLLKKYTIETIEYLNKKFQEMNKRGIYVIEDLKCNFDLEIGRDMLLDFERNKINTFVLWSADSDFFDPIQQLLADKKKVVLFATSGVVARELNDLRNEGLFIFDIQKIREFICWKKQT